MIEIGKTYDLTVVKLLDFGAYLDAKELGEILLPYKFVTDDLLVGDSIRVFLYLDSEDRPVATTQKPKASVGEFAYLKVIDLSRVGAFLDWGLDKDLLVPFSEQHMTMVENHSYLAYIHCDENDGRIVATSKIDKLIVQDPPEHFKVQQEVDLIIAHSTDLGYKAIINHQYWGLLYKEDIFIHLNFGQKIKGFIKNIRPDGKIDLSLHGGQQTRDQYSDTILRYLNAKQGFAPVHDKSDPELITDLFGMSKGAFKKAIGQLYKQRIIRIDKQGIYLN